jgi:mono/diheme cytochrome c family protein
LPNRRRNAGLGCALLALLIIVAFAAAAALWGQPLIAQLTGESVVLADHTSATELAARHNEETARLSNYGWIDREANLIHIPVDRAIELIAESGLPVGGAEILAEAEVSAEPEAVADEEPIPAESAQTAQIDLANVSFQAHVLPIFQQHCVECHGDEEAEEGLKLTNYRTVLGGSQNGSVVEPGDPEGSYLVTLVTEGRMPKRGDPLSAAEIEIIVAWITAGALDN